jgi:hypothetical protein
LTHLVKQWKGKELKKRVKGVDERATRGKKEKSKKSRESSQKNRHYGEGASAAVELGPIGKTMGGTDGRQ